MKPIPAEAIALIIGFGLLIVIADRIWPAEPFYFWSGVALVAFGAIALTPWGERLR